MSTSPLSPDELRAAAEVHRELGTEYGDAVLETFLAKIDKELDARIEARLAASVHREAPPDPAVTRARQRTQLTYMALGTVTAGVPITAVAWYWSDKYPGGSPLNALLVIWIG